MVSGPITSWQIDGETMETVIDFIFLSSKTTADCDCSHEIKTRSGHRTGKDQFSFQFQRKAMQKNAQTTAQLHSSHMLVK